MIVNIMMRINDRILPIKSRFPPKKFIFLVSHPYYYMSLRELGTVGI